MISLVSLQNEYNSLYQKYKNEYDDFISSNPRDLQKFVSLNNKAFWGKTALSDSTVQTQSDCINLCTSNKDCSGATFVPSNNQCFLRSGINPISNLQDNIALVSVFVLKLSVLSSYNQQLQSIIQQINDFISNNSQSFDIDNDTIRKNVAQLKADSILLSKENQNLQDLIHQHTNINMDIQNNQQIANSNYYVFSIYFSLFLFIVSLSFFIIFPNSAPSLVILFIISIILFFS